MKRILSIILIITLIAPLNSFAAQTFDTLVPEFTAMITDTADATEYTGYSKGLELLTNSYFTDVTTDPYEEEITRLSALGIVNQYGDRKFYPGQDVTGYEVLGILVRMLGGENAVMQNVYAQTGSSSSTQQVTQIMNQEYLNQATALGIITANEIVGLSSAATKEQITVWTARAIGITPVYTQSVVFSFNDWQYVSPTSRALIETMVDDGIVPVNNDGSFGPKDTVSRSEMALIAKSALATQYATLGLESGYGLIFGVSEDTIYEDGNTIKRKTITVQNTDGSVTKLLYETHTQGNRTYDFVVYKNGYVTDATSLKIGDEIEYVLDAGEVKYAQVMDNDLILQKIESNTLADVYATFHYGVVSEIKTENSYNLGSSIISDIIRVVDVSGDTFDIRVDEELYSGLRNDIITYKDDTIGGVGLIEEGDSVEYLVNENNEVIYIRVEPIDTTVISGSVREVKDITEDSAAQMTVYGYDDQLYTYPLAPYVDLTINDRYTDLENFVYGMNVTLEIYNGYVVSAAAESYTGTPGYIPEYGKMRIGSVDSVYSSTFRIELSNGTYEFVTVDAGTAVTKDGNAVSFSALKVGDDVKVYYDDIYTTNASKIEIEAPEILFEIIYKGKIKNVNEAREEITFIGTDGVSKPQYISNNAWESADSYTLTLNYSDSTEVYLGNKALSIEELERSYENYTAYAVVKSVFGEPEIVMLTVKTGGEMFYSSTVRTIDHTTNKFDIQTKENFNLTDGTIVIKDGLIVPTSTISARDTVFIVSESPYGTYEQNAMIVKVVTPFDDIFDGIRIGALENVNTNTLTLRNYTSYTNNFLNAVTSTESGYYKMYTSTNITDITDPDDIVTMTPYELFNGSYSKWDNVDSTYSSSTRGLQYDRYYAFMVVNEADNSIIAMHLRQNGLMDGQNIDDNLYNESDIADELEDTFQDAVLSRGMVVSNDETWDRLEITDSHDWTDYTGQWSANLANIYIQYTDAIFIKNNRVITVDDVEDGDYIYIMRIKEDALVIFVES